MEGFPFVSPTRGLTTDGRAAMACCRLWEAAHEGAAVCRTDLFRETRIVAWLTVWGGFEHLAEARDAVSLETGDARKVYGFDSEGYLIKTRNR